MSAVADPMAVQVRYGRGLAWGARVGFALLLIGFVAYMTGLVDPHVPIERLAALWHRPAGEMMREVGLPPGWAWSQLIHRSDMLMLAGVALLASCSLACLAAVIPLFHARRERVFVIVCAMQIAVLLLAGSGILVVAH